MRRAEPAVASASGGVNTSEISASRGSLPSGRALLDSAARGGSASGSRASGGGASTTAAAAGATWSRPATSSHWVPTLLCRRVSTCRPGSGTFGSSPEKRASSLKGPLCSGPGSTKYPPIAPKRHPLSGFESVGAGFSATEALPAAAESRIAATAGTADALFSNAAGAGRPPALPGTPGTMCSAAAATAAAATAEAVLGFVPAPGAQTLARSVATSRRFGVLRLLARGLAQKAPSNLGLEPPGPEGEGAASLRQSGASAKSGSAFGGVG